MRVWSLHPRYLDRQALIACWRESLLAQAVLAGATRGYIRHPQLHRFRALPDPLAGIGCYLAGLAAEADLRGYRFDRGRIRSAAGAAVEAMDVTDGQLAFEWEHLMAKLESRSPETHERWTGVEQPDPHPLFRKVPGPVAEWERAVTGPSAPAE